MKIRDALNNIDVNLGYVRLIKIGESNSGTERMLDSLTTHELMDILEKEPKAVWNVGEYWNIAYQG